MTHGRVLHFVVCVPALLVSTLLVVTPDHHSLKYMPYEEITSTLRCGARGTARLVF